MIEKFELFFVAWGRTNNLKININVITRAPNDNIMQK